MFRTFVHLMEQVKSLKSDFEDVKAHQQWDNAACESYGLVVGTVMNAVCRNKKVDGKTLGS